MRKYNIAGKICIACFMLGVLIYLPMFTNKPHLVYGLILAPAGVIAGVFLTATSIGEGYWIFILASPPAIFLMGALFWYLLMMRAGGGYAMAVLVGLLSGTLSHFLCWYILILSNFLLHPQDGINPLLALQASLIYSFFSVLFLGPLTAGWSVVAALIFKRVKG